MGLSLQKARVAFQGEPGAFSEAAAIQLLGEKITPVPRPTFDATFRAIAECAADALLVPVENSLAGLGVRGFGPLLPRQISLVSESILPHQLHLHCSARAFLCRTPSLPSPSMGLPPR